LPFPQAAVRAQVERILAAPRLVQADGLGRLLRFVVEETLGGRSAQLKETRLGLEVFRRSPATYDGAIDPIVRVQMGRLRVKLREYYASDGAGDPIVIDVPAGSYVPVFRSRESDTGRTPSLLPEANPPRLRVAVLPFVNMSPAPDGEYFSDGLTEELINLLARDRQVQVVARTSSFQFKHAHRDIREIGRQLDVGKIIEGSVRQSGTRVRITAQLIDVANGCHVWSERFERELTDLFAIHEEIASAIQQSLQAQLIESAIPFRAPPKVRSLAAYNHYLQGRCLWNKRTEQDLRAAIGHFEAAVRADSDFARAYSGSADCHLMLAMSGADDPNVRMPQARAAAQRALELDELSAEAHTSLAAVKNCYEWDYAAAQKEYREAQRLDPFYATAFHWDAFFNRASLGQLTEAVAQLEHAIELDPLSTPILGDLGLIHCFRGDHESAERQFCRAIELDLHFHRPYWFLGLSLACHGQFAEAERTLKLALERCRDHAFETRIMGTLGFCLARAKQPRRAAAIRQQLERMTASRYVARFDVAQILAGAENPNDALTELEAAVDTRESFVPMIRVWPTFESLRCEPRFRRLLARIEGSSMLP
jgi:adenylate cyclase